MRPLLPILLCALTLAVPIGAWSDDAPADSVAAPSDTVAPAPPRDTVRYLRTSDLDRFLPSTDSVDLERRLSQNPMVALFKSMLVPGWGQFGNGAYVKAILFFGLDAWLVSSAIDHGRKASDYFDSYQSAADVTDRNLWYDRYDDERSRRNKYTWFAVIVSFVSMFDAYVDAHFSGFPDADRARRSEPGLSLNLEPAPEGGVTATLSLTF
ncbi:MAG TPA: DUF5683 domain-containing protein [candidate division Zixibacteria bacterium]|nr:DUF5683 domain-containing protein [candidate division Zixibacteria bacterium]